MISRPRNGIRFDLALADYHAIDAASSGRLRDLGRSPAYCRYAIDHPTGASEAMNVGGLVDALLLAPEEVDGYCAKTWDGRTKEGRALTAQAEEDGQVVLSAAAWDRAHEIAAAVTASPWFASLTDTWRQVSVLWTDAEYDYPCKARPDILQPDRGILCDLKVCRQAVPSQYLRACVGLWHPQQLAWYARGLEEHGIEVQERWILAVHPEPPHEVTAYRMTPDLNAWADRVVAERLALYADCARSGSWPGPGDEVDVPLPEWAQSEGKPEVDFSELEVEEE